MKDYSSALERMGSVAYNALHSSAVETAERFSKGLLADIERANSLANLATSFKPIDLDAIQRSFITNYIPNAGVFDLAYSNIARDAAQMTGMISSAAKSQQMMSAIVRQHEIKQEFIDSIERSARFKDQIEQSARFKDQFEQAAKFKESMLHF